MAEEMLKLARNDLADAHERHKSELQEAHARHTSELQEQAQPAEQLTQQVLQLVEEEVTLHQTASTPVVGDTSWRQLEMPSPSPPLLMPTSAHAPRRCMLNIKAIPKQRHLRFLLLLANNTSVAWCTTRW